MSADPSAPRTAPLTQTLAAHIGDRYVIERELGRGGMAAVYLAKDTRHGRQVALKVLDADVAGSVGVDRFLREIRIAAKLAHPHIVPLYDSGESAGAVFYVMPYVAGETLRDRLHRGPMALPDVARYARELASALDYAHRQGVVHRDIKPDNIMLAEGHAVITDFGIARALAEASLPSLTNTGVVIGTPTYMSPEQAAGGDTAIDGRCDQYSLGCVLFEMLAGKAPFTGSSVMSLIAQHMASEPPRIEAPEPIPESAEKAIRRALAKAPDDRFASVTELAIALDSATSERPRRISLELPTAVSRSPGSRLPVPLTPLVGRDREVQTISALLRQSVRLLTLHGPGGIGKTRLALEVASRATDHFADGIWFVALAEVRDTPSLIARIAQTIGLRGAAATSNAVRDHLRDRNALLLLDNFEQLADVASGEVASLLGDCPHLKALVTSQALLRVYGEHEFRVEPLPLPDARHMDPASIERSPAVQLFHQRATAARPDFVIDAENAAAIVEICSRLDGVPLAIELAASRVRNTTPQALLPKLRDSIALLTTGARDVPERQRTMRSAIAWAHDLLSPGERTVFRRLAVFSGGATASSLEPVCGCRDVDASDVLEALADRSLLRRHIDAAGEARFTLLRPVLTFANEMLDAAGERVATADRHAVHFRGLALEAEAHVGIGEDTWLDRLESDHDNLRAAFERLLEQGIIEDALRMGIALWRYWEARSFAREGLEQLHAATDVMTEDIPANIRLTALFAAGVLADSCGDVEMETHFFERHLALTEQQGDKAAIAIARGNVGIIRMRQGQPDDAIGLFRQGADAMREVQNWQAMALSIANVGNAEKMRGNFAAARDAYAEAREALERIGDRINVGWILSHLGDVARDEGDRAEARARYREGLAIFVQLGHKRGMSNILTDLGEMLAGQGDLLEARGLLEEALVNVADLGDQRAMLRVFEVLAGIASQQEQDERAVTLAGAVAGLRDRLGAPMSAADRSRLQFRISASMHRMDESARDPAWQAGVEMSIDEVVRYVTTPQARPAPSV